MRRNTWKIVISESLDSRLRVPTPNGREDDEGEEEDTFIFKKFKYFDGRNVVYFNAIIPLKTYA